MESGSEHYVKADAVAEHLGIERRQVLHMTRAKKLPAYPVDPTAARKTWRYKLSEVDHAIAEGAKKQVAGTSKNRLGGEGHYGDNRHGSPRSQRREL